MEIIVKFLLLEVHSDEKDLRISGISLFFCGCWLELESVLYPLQLEDCGIAGETHHSFNAEDGDTALPQQFSDSYLELLGLG